MNKLTIETVLTKVDSLQQNFHTLGRHVHTLDQTFHALNQNFDALNKNFDALSRCFETFQQNVDSLSQNVDSLQQAVMQRIERSEERAAVRFDKAERTLDEHTVAFLELSTMSAGHSALHRDHSLALGRIERRLRGDIRTLDDPERRVKDVQKRPLPPAPGS